jgi:hypothetical protein
MAGLGAATASKSGSQLDVVWPARQPDPRLSAPEVPTVSLTFPRLSLRRPAAIISRQLLDLPRSRIESLLTSFPKLIPAGSQHTTVETADVRYVYQPMDDVWVVLITNLGSNILQVRPRPVYC